MTKSVYFLCMACFVSSGQARIGMRGASRNELISIETVDNSLMSELAGALGQSNHARILRIEDEMRPMYAALPKTPEGTLNQAGVRYGLHRFFVQLHGWHVKGLEPDGGSWDSASPTDMLKDRVPGHVISLVEGHLHGRGFGLHELAVLAATLDDLIHSEAIERLHKAYAAHEVPIEAKTNRQMVDLILQTYMVFYILPNEQFKKLSSSKLKRLLPTIPRVYPGWDDTMMWVRDLQKSMEYNERDQRNPFKPPSSENEEEIDFASVAQIVEEVNGKFGRFQDLECRSMKWTLTEMEESDSGRVLLSNFYGNALNEGGWQFTESADYLRDLGALDETDPSRPSVVLANYLNGRSNCLAASSFYSVCCIDECEALMVQIESKIASPLGAPADLSRIVSGMSTDTIDAPRNLSSTLLMRLNDIAAQNDGKVPLHGRLFSQWLHHAFPRECPMPKVPGSTTAPMTAAEWMKASNTNRSTASQEEMERHATPASEEVAQPEAVAPVEVPWSEEEELVMIVDAAVADRWWFTASLRNFAFAAVVLSAAASLYRTSRSAVTELPMYCGSAKFGKAHYV